MKHVKKSLSKKIFRVMQVIAISFLVAGIFATSIFLVWASTIEIPDFSLFESRKVSQSTKIYDRTGKILLYDVHKDVRRTTVPFESISSYIKNAAIAIEDEEFYQHRGIQPKAILRAVLVNLKLREGYAGQGGSTITQQVIKNALLSQEKTITRKVKEWILALKLERIMSKEQILSLYLNESPYGGNIYGIEEASMSFFGKHAGDLTLAESSYLAALPQAPTLYSPYGNNTDRLELRKNLVLRKMRAREMITEEEYAQAQKEQVHFIPPQERGIKAPHFVMYIKEKLAEEYGEDVLHEGGLRVITTIDMELQEKAEVIVKKYASENAKKFNAQNAALVAIDPRSGDILTMVGSRDYFDTEYDGNYNIAVAKRQPGSAFKPFVYAAAFEKGYTPNTVVFDTATQFSTHCDYKGMPLPGSDASQCYMPQNYDSIYRGPISLRDALAQSINVPAVKLLYLVGLDHAIDMAERLGITSLVDKARYGLTLVLGGGEVSLLEMTSAYGVFANEGKRVPYNGIIKIENSIGQLIYEHTTKEVQVVPTEVARQISDVLSDNTARTPAFGADSFLRVSGRDVAVKTGTTNDYRDAWIIGYTPTLAVGAWAGNNDNTPMEKKVAGFIIAPLWNSFFSNASSSLANESFVEPLPVGNETKPVLRGVWYGSETYNVDKISGKIATEFTPSHLIEERAVPNPHEILYWVNKEDPTGIAPENPYKDQQFLLWELPAQEWITKNGLPTKASHPSVGTPDDDIHRPELAPRVRIYSPTASTTYPQNEKITVQPEIMGSFILSRVDYFVNGVFLGTASYAPFEFSFIPSQMKDIRSENELRIVVYDVVGNSTSISQLLKIETTQDTIHQTVNVDEL